MKSNIAYFCGILLFGLLTTVQADVKPAHVFSHHMVLQREMKVPIWGEAAAGEAVKVSFQGQQKSVKADADGKWKVFLDPLKVGGPHELTIEGNNTIHLKDVLVGDVWLGSGQSNMAGGTGGYAKRDEVLAGFVKAGPYPKMRLLKSKGSWQVAEEKAINGFSAILFSFGHRLHQELDVPIGLMVGAVGGTPSGRWLTPEMLKNDAGCMKAVQDYKPKQSFEELQAKYEKALAKWEVDSAKAKENKKKGPRKPKAPAKPGDFNSRAIGSLYKAHIEQFVGYGIRGVLWDQGESGTTIQEIDQYNVMGALIKGWRKAWGQGEFPFIHVQKPSGGGCAWETEGNPITRMGEKFAAKMPANVVKDNGLYREMHIRISEHPNTAMAIASDLGPGIHPMNKSGYGYRAARVALGMAYGKDMQYYGPVYKGHKIEGNKIRIEFDHIGQGLTHRHGEKLQGFIVAGSDKKFHLADAKIDGNAILVSSPQVAAPVAARYAWARKHTWANLFNKDGLPALTFRTDDW